MERIPASMVVSLASVVLVSHLPLILNRRQPPHSSCLKKNFRVFSRFLEFAYLLSVKIQPHRNES